MKKSNAGYTVPHHQSDITLMNSGQLIDTIIKAIINDVWEHDHSDHYWMKDELVRIRIVYWWNAETTITHQESREKFGGHFSPGLHVPGNKIPCLWYLVTDEKISQGGRFYPGVKCPRGSVPVDKIPWGQDKPVHRNQATTQWTFIPRW